MTYEEYSMQNSSEKVNGSKTLGLEMSEEQINIAIAEALGLDVIHDPAGPKGRPDAWKTAFFTPKAAKQRRIAWPSSAVVKVVPKYCRDLNAMHEAVAYLTPEQVNNFAVKLAQIVLENYCGDDVWWALSANEVGHVANATACQRAEAFLWAIGKWKKGEK